MSDTFILNKGSDLNFKFNWKDSQGNNLDLTGYSLFIEEVSSSIQNYFTSNIENAGTGLINCSLQWNSSIGLGRHHYFRIGIRQGATEYTTNRLYIEVV